MRNERSYTFYCETEGSLPSLHDDIIQRCIPDESTPITLIIKSSRRIWRTMLQRIHKLRFLLLVNEFTDDARNHQCHHPSQNKSRAS